jgi:large conductance mechanosensitive channel
MFDGFKKFIARGNVMELAVAVIMGVAIGAVVDSLVKDIITPIIGLIGGQPDFSAIKPAGIGIGSFVNSVISFLMKAAAVYFFIVVPFNRFAAIFMAPPPPPPAVPTPSGKLLGEIRDLLKAGSR